MSFTDEEKICLILVSVGGILFVGGFFAFVLGVETIGVLVFCVGMAMMALGIIGRPKEEASK